MIHICDYDLWFTTLRVGTECFKHFCLNRFSHFRPILYMRENRSPSENNIRLVECSSRRRECREDSPHYRNGWHFVSPKWCCCCCYLLRVIESSLCGMLGDCGGPEEAISCRMLMLRWSWKIYCTVEIQSHCEQNKVKWLSSTFISHFKVIFTTFVIMSFDRSGSQG